MPESRENETQLIFELPVESNIGRDDLMESEANKIAVDLIDDWPNWPSNTVILAGPIGSGKTHLAKIWAAKSQALVAEFSSLKGNISSIEPGRSLVLENINSGNIDEDLLFHCFNQTKSNGCFLLLTSREFPAAWQLKLEDLKSRLRTAHTVELQEPDDKLLSRILVKLFADRQLFVEPNLISYLVTRMERSLGAAGEIVTWMDKEALATGGKVNRTLAAKALSHFENQ